MLQPVQGLPHLVAVGLVRSAMELHPARIDPDQCGRAKLASHPMPVKIHPKPFPRVQPPPATAPLLLPVGRPPQALKRLGPFEKSVDFTDHSDEVPLWKLIQLDPQPAQCAQASDRHVRKT